MNTENTNSTLKVEYRLYDETFRTNVSINEIGPNATVEKVLTSVGIDWFDFPNYAIHVRHSGLSRRVAPLAKVNAGDEIVFLPN